MSRRDVVVGTAPAEHAGLSDLAARAVELLGIPEPASLVLVRHGENVVYRVEDATGVRSALRLHRPGYHHRVGIESELAWMRSLRAAGVATPPARTSTAGETVMCVPPRRGLEGRFCVAFEWIDGERLEATDPTKAFLLLGELMARMHAHARAWEGPTWFTRAAWDAESLAGPTPRWGSFAPAAAWSGEELAALRRSRDTVLRRLDKLGVSGELFGLVHADLTPTNVLVRGGRPVVIDFDDCGPGWFAYDAAVALWEYETDPRFATLRGLLAEGYRRVAGHDLPGLEELPTFLMARRLALLGWLASRADSAHAKATTRRRVTSTPAATRAYLRWAGGSTTRTAEGQRIPSS